MAEHKITCAKCGSDDYMMLTRQNPKGEAGVFWCDKCTGENLTSFDEALVAAITGDDDAGT